MYVCDTADVTEEDLRRLADLASGAILRVNGEYDLGPLARHGSDADEVRDFMHTHLGECPSCKSQYSNIYAAQQSIGGILLALVAGEADPRIESVVIERDIGRVELHRK